MGSAYYFSYANAASANYYQYVSTDYSAAIIGYYANMGYACLYYYMSQGYTNYGFSLYYSNLASAAYTLGWLANYHTYNGLALYYGLADSAPELAMSYLSSELYLAQYYQSYGYYSDLFAGY